MKTMALCLVLAAMAACGKGDDKKAADKAKPTPKPEPAPPAPEPEPAPPADAPKTVTLGDLGQIDVPSGWTLKQINDDTFTFRIPAPMGTNIPPRVDVVRTKTGPKTVDEAAKGCPAKVIEKKKLDDGRFYYVCEQTAVGRTLRNFQVIRQEPSGAFIACSGNAGDITALLSACETLRAP